MTLDEKLKNIQMRYENGNISSYEKEVEELEARFNSDELRMCDEYQLNKLRIEKEYGKISDFDYDMRAAEILYKNASEKERNIAFLDVQRKHGVIDKQDYINKTKEINGEPYAAIKFEYENNGDGGMLVTSIYNKPFVELLKKLHYEGNTDEELVDGWVRVKLANIIQSDDYELMPYNDVVVMDDED